MAYDSWYCGLPSFISDRIGDCVPTASDQVTIMRGNFGPNADPNLVEEAVGGFQNWLDVTGYDDKIQKLENNSFNYLPLLLGIGVIGLALSMGSSPRRYGR